MKNVVLYGVIVICILLALAWLFGGGYTDWRLDSVVRKEDWLFKAPLIQQWIWVVLWDRLTQVLLVAITVVVVFCRFYGRYIDRKFQDRQREERRHNEKKVRRDAYWRHHLN